jgi:hypothetical protein
MSQPAFLWDADVNLPVSGRTPLARHCSATGAQAAAVSITGKLAKLLAFFAMVPQGTLQEFAAAHGWQNNAVCSTVDRAKYELQWIEETGAVKRVTWSGGRQTSQAYHRLTADGRRAWLGHVERQVRGIEARP